MITPINYLKHGITTIDKMMDWDASSEGVHYNKEKRADIYTEHLTRLIRFIRQHPEHKEELQGLKDTLQFRIQKLRVEHMRFRMLELQRASEMPEITLPLHPDLIRDPSLDVPESQAEPAPEAPAATPLPDIIPDLLYPLAEAAKCIGRSKNTLYCFNAEKPEPRIPFKKNSNGRGVVYLGSDLLAFREGKNTMTRAIDRVLARAKTTKKKKGGNGSPKLTASTEPKKTRFKRPRLSELQAMERTKRQTTKGDNGPAS